MPGEPVGEEGEEECRAHAAAELPERGVRTRIGTGGGGGPSAPYGVAYGPHEPRQHAADAQAQHPRRKGVQGLPGVLRRPAQQPHRAARQRAAQDREQAVAAGTAGEVGAEDRAERETGRRGQHQQARAGR